MVISINLHLLNRINVYLSWKNYRFAEGIFKKLNTIKYLNFDFKIIIFIAF